MNKISQKLRNNPASKIRFSRRLAMFAFFVRNGLWSFRWRGFSIAYPILVSGLILFVVIPGLAYASAEVVPGHWLYGVKKAVEKIEIVVAQKQAEPAILQKHSERRLEEAENISRGIKPAPELEVLETPAIQEEQKAALKEVISEAVKNNLAADKILDRDKEKEQPAAEGGNLGADKARTEKKPEPEQRINAIAEKLDKSGFQEEAKWAREEAKKLQADKNGPEKKESVESPQLEKKNQGQNEAEDKKDKEDSPGQDKEKGSQGQGKNR